MKRFKNILVVINNDTNTMYNPALLRGLELAEKNNGRLTLMDVIAPPDAAITEYKDILKPKELITLLVSKRKNTLTKIAEQIGDHVDIHIKVCVGRDFIEIVRQVVSESHDLLIKVANDHPDSFDSSDFHLMRKCPQPVWLLKAKDQGRCQNILAAIDLKLEADEDGKGLNTLIMDLSTSLAEWENSHLHLLSCWSLYGEKNLRDSSFFKVSKEELSRLLIEEERANLEIQNQLVKRYEKVSIHQHLIKGNPVEYIPAFAKQNNIDVVVMGTVARSGIPGLLIGNTSETILHSIGSSVITVKPRGFESIIR